MPDKISINDLFKAGLNKEQFKSGVVAGQNSFGLESIYSLFGDNVEGAAENIFKELDTNKNGKMDEVELNELKKKFQDEDQDAISENDVESLILSSAKQRYGTDDPAKMYRNAVKSAGNPQSSNYVPELDSKIDTLQNLIIQRKDTSKVRTAAYQSDIDQLVKDTADKKGINSSEYTKNASALKNLQAKKKEKEKEAEEIKLKLEQAKKDRDSLEYEYKTAQSKKGREDELEGIKFDLDNNQSLIKSLEGKSASIDNEIKSLTPQISAYTNKQETLQDNILKGDKAAKSKVKELKTKIDQETKDANKDIQNYTNEIKILNNARDYAIKEMTKAAMTQSQTEADADFSNTGKNCPSLKDINYSSAKGQKLANYMRSHAIGFTGHCSRYVANGLAATGLGHERTASAHMMDTPLSKNGNFKEITVSSKEELKNLPAGCIIVYEAGAAGYNRTHGHIEVTLGNGTNASDGITRNPRYAGFNRMHVFVPVG